MLPRHPREFFPFFVLFFYSEDGAIARAEQSRTNIREITLQALLLIEEGGFSNTVITEALDKHARIDARDRALFVRMVHGTLEYQFQLDRILNRYSSINAGKMKPLIRNLLRMSVYQLLYLDRIPSAAVVDEAVRLVKKSPLRNLSGFVNGVLRSIDREKTEITFTDRAEKYAIPDELLAVLDRSLGDPAVTDAFLQYSLEDHGVQIRTAGTDEIRTVREIGNLTETPEWKSGRIIVQDYASLVPVRLSSIRPGDTVLDVCAAPGGKSIRAAERTGSTGRVIACDLTEKKLNRIRENCERLGVTNVECRVCDAAVRMPELLESADVVLADLPCSGLGTIGKKPEIKTRITAADLQALAEIQQKILNNVCDYVRPGGELIFSTCTIDYMENEDNADAFLKAHPEFSETFRRQLLPTPQQDMDGFFVCIMRKDRRNQTQDTANEKQ